LFPLVLKFPLADLLENVEESDTSQCQATGPVTKPVIDSTAGAKRHASDQREGGAIRQPVAQCHNTANGAAEMIKEIVANIKTNELEILFRMDSGYFDEDIIETIELLGCMYLIKGKEYPTLASQVTAPSIVFVNGDEGRETTELFTQLNTWHKDRRYVVSLVLKPEKDRAQLSLLEGNEYEYFFFVNNTDLPSEKVVISYEKRGNSEKYTKEAKYDMAVGHLLLKSFWANEAIFQMMMLAYNLFLLFKFDSLHISEYRQQIKTFRLKYVFLAAKIIRTARYIVMKLSTKYPYQDVYKNCLS
jgi:hypothetical protein